MLFMFMSVFTCTSRCTCAYVYMGVEVRGQWQVSSFNKLHKFFYENDLSLKLQFTVWPGSSRMSQHILFQVRYIQARH